MEKILPIVVKGWSVFLKYRRSCKIRKNAFYSYFCFLPVAKEIRIVGNSTHHLDDVFKENLKEDPLLKWQYFCSSTGFFKFYPGKIKYIADCYQELSLNAHNWIDFITGAMWEVQLADLKLDFFDCRSTAW